jgi:cell division protein FtsB
MEVMLQVKTKIVSLLNNSKLMNVVIVSLLIAFGLLYIVQVNSSATRGLALRELEEQNQSLKVAYQSTAAKIDELRSLDSVMQREQLLGLVKASQVSYITKTINTVALR